MRLLIFVPVMLMVASCATTKPVTSKTGPEVPPSIQVSPAPAEADDDSKQVSPVQGGSVPGPARMPSRSVDVPSVSISAPAVTAQPHKNKAARGPEGQPYQIQVDNMPLSEFINLVFGKVLDVGYSVDKSVEKRKETVTLNMKATARRSEILEIAGEVLKTYGLGITEKEGVFFVGPITGQPQKPVIPYFVGNVPETVSGSDIVGLFLQPSYIRTQDFASIAASLALSAQGKVQALSGNTIVCFIDDAGHARAAAELLRALDRPSLSGKKMKIYYLNYLPVDTFIGYLTQALPAQGIPVAKTPGDMGMMLVPLKQIRAVLAVSLKPEWLNQVLFWQEKLDLRTVSEDEPQFYVYHPKNRRASDLAKLFGAGGGGRRKGPQPGQQETGGKPEISPEAMGLQPAKGTSASEPEKQSHPISLTDVSVSIDEGTNSLVFTATPFQYSRVEDILRKLDTPPRQVLIEVTIGEVTLTGQYQFGIEWAFKHYGLFQGTLGTLGKLSLSTSSGFVYSVIGPSGFQAALNAFASDNVLKVISTPSLVVLDNQDASIDVGDQVPILTSQATAPGVTTTGGETQLLQSIQYQKTGVILHIKPTINSQGMLTLQLKQEVSNATANTTSSISSPVITTREIDTSVALKTGSSILLGGLMTNQVNSTVNKVPGLGDIPLLRTLFSTTSRNTTRTELFVQITPHILSNEVEAEDATRKFKDLLDLFK